MFVLVINMADVPNRLELERDSIHNYLRLIGKYKRKHRRYNIVRLRKLETYFRERERVRDEGRLAAQARQTHDTVEYYKMGGNPADPVAVRTHRRNMYTQWNTQLRTAYYDDNMMLGRDNMRSYLVNKFRADPNYTPPTKRFIADWLKQQYSYQMSALKNHKSRGIQAIIANKPLEYVQADTMFINKLLFEKTSEKDGKQVYENTKEDDFDAEEAKDNNSMGLKGQYIGCVTMIDAVTRKAWAYPIKHVDSITAKRVLVPDPTVRGYGSGLVWDAEEYFDGIGFDNTHLKKIQTDKGSEFMLNFRQEMKILNLNSNNRLYKHQFSQAGKSAAQSLIERFHLTFKNILENMVPRNENGRHNWNNWHLQINRALEVYNNRVHSTTGMAPNSIRPNNIEKARRNTRTVARSRFVNVFTEFKKGDYVRIYNYNKNKRMREPNYSWGGGGMGTGPLVEMVEDVGEFFFAPELKEKYEDLFQGIYIINKVERGRQVGSGRSTLTRGHVGREATYHIVAKWSKEKSDLIDDANIGLGTRPSAKIREARKTVNIPGHLFHETQYPERSYTRKFTKDELLLLSTHHVDINGSEYKIPIINKNPGNGLLRLRGGGDDGDDKKKPKTDSPRRSTRLKKQVDHIIQYANNHKSVQLMYKGESKPTTVDVNLVKDTLQYAKWLQNYTQRKNYMKNKKTTEKRLLPQRKVAKKEEEGEYVVEKILAYNKKKRRVKVKWKGYDKPDWQPQRNFVNNEAWLKFKREQQK